MKRGIAESYNRLVNAFVIACDTCIVGGLFHRFYHWAQDTAWEKTLQASEFQIVATLMLCYLLCAMHTGVILYRRKVFAYEVLTRVTKNVVFFAILGGGILQLGGYMDAWSKLFLAYLLAVLVCVSVFRLGLRMLIKAYRTKGGNLRYVVLVGSTDNNRELYQELTSQSWAG